MRKLGATLILVAVLGVAPPTWADEEDWCDGEGACSSERDYDFSFQESPVQIGDVTLCAPLSTCEFHGDGEEQEGDETPT